MKHILTLEQFLYDKTTLDFEKWFSGSKIVDSNGEPMICYHRSKFKFDKFDENFITKNGWVGNGFYFSDNKNSFKEYGRCLYKCYLNITNPYISNADTWFDFNTEVCEKFNNGIIDNYKITELLKDNGFDGVIYHHWDKGAIISCFYANQIMIIK